EQQVLLARGADRVEQAAQAFGVFEIGRHAAAAFVGLRQYRTAEAVAAGAEIDEPEFGLARVHAQLRCQRIAYVADPRERADDQRHRRDGALLALAVAPQRAHRQRILADRDRNAERGTQLQG